MSEEISVLISATDEASSVIADASDQINTSLNEVSEAAGTLGSEVTDAMNSASDGMEQAKSAAAGLQSTAEEAADATSQVTVASTSLASAQDSATGSMKSAARALGLYYWGSGGNIYIGTRDATTYTPTVFEYNTKWGIDRSKQIGTVIVKGASIVNGAQIQGSAGAFTIADRQRIKLESSLDESFVLSFSSYYSEIKRHSCNHY